MKNLSRLWKRFWSIVSLHIQRLIHINFEVQKETCIKISLKTAAHITIIGLFNTLFFYFWVSLNFEDIFSLNINNLNPTKIDWYKIHSIKFNTEKLVAIYCVVAIIMTIKTKIRYASFIKFKIFNQWHSQVSNFWVFSGARLIFPKQCNT